VRGATVRTRTPANPRGVSLACATRTDQVDNHRRTAGSGTISSSPLKAELDEQHRLSRPSTRAIIDRNMTFEGARWPAGRGHDRGGTAGYLDNRSGNHVRDRLRCRHCARLVARYRLRAPVLPPFLPCRAAAVWPRHGGAGREAGTAERRHLPPGLNAAGLLRCGCCCLLNLADATGYGGQEHDDTADRPAHGCPHCALMHISKDARDLI
jgi:hypothetical protein